MSFIHLVPTAASLILAQAIGYAWYHPSVWGTRWLAAMKQSNPTFAPSTDARVYVVSAIMWLVSSLIYTTLVELLDTSELHDLLELSVVMCVGFAAPPYILAVVHEQKNKVVSLIGFGYMVTVFLAMAVCHAVVRA